MSKRNVISAIVGLALLLFGMYIGHEKGVKSCSYMQKAHVESSATDLRVKIKLLTLIRNGEIDKSEELLEYLVDNDVSYLYATLKTDGDISTDVVDAIKEAKRYREKYPYHQPVAEASKTIRDAFQNISTIAR